MAFEISSHSIVQTRNIWIRWFSKNYFYSCFDCHPSFLTPSLHLPLCPSLHWVGKSEKSSSCPRSSHTCHSVWCLNWQLGSAVRQRRECESLKSPGQSFLRAPSTEQLSLEWLHKCPTFKHMWSLQLNPSLRVSEGSLTNRRLWEVLPSGNVFNFYNPRLPVLLI